jgi:hypothetical protein
MAKTTAPLLSFGASGQIGKSIVASKWKGRSYMRRHVVPANPQTTAQTSTRDMFNFLGQVYKRAPALFTDPWDLFATGQVLTPRNAFTGQNITAMRNPGTTPDTNLNDMIMSPGAKGGIMPKSAVATPGSTQLSIAVTAPSVIPPGWTIFSAVAAAIRDQNPTSGILYDITAIEDLSSPYTCVLTGLTASVSYQWGAWLKWNKPDGTFAFSAALRGQATPTV